MNDNIPNRIDAAQAQWFVRQIMETLGTPVAQAQQWAGLLIETSLLGLDSHGLRMLERYVSHIEGGGMRVAQTPSIVHDAGACAVMDAHGGFGHLAAHAATQLALEKAQRNGIAMVSVRNGNHVGACGLYALRCAEADCIGLCSTVSRGGIAPWGGKQPLLGINPLAVSAPIADHPAFLYDAAASTVSMGKVTAAADRGVDIPDAWALDGDGRPTTDPAAAILGSLLPIGGYKGYGLTMALEMLCALLSGGALAHQVRSWIQQTAEPTGASFTAIAINIASFVAVTEFKQRMGAWVEQLTTSELREGFERICYPGQIEAETCAKRSANGIPLTPDEFGMLQRLAERFEMSPPTPKTS